MIFSKIFRRHYFVSIVILLGFMGIGFVVIHFVLRSAMDFERPPHPIENIAILLEEVPVEKRKEVVLKLSISKMGRSGPFSACLIDLEGKSVSPENCPTPNDLWTKLENIQSNKNPIFEADFDRTPKPMYRELTGTKKQFLFFPAMGGNHGPPTYFIAIPILVNIVSILVGVGLALYLIFRSVKEKKDIADQVIGELRNGNLKSRFPVSGTDEINQMMTRFNKMADEIEKLFVKVQKAEKTRMNLLQELAHDLRTPIASLKNLLETIYTKKDSMSKDLLGEFSFLSLKEIGYFERLVEDLLLLAQVSEPEYSQMRELVMINDLLLEEIDSLSAKYSEKNLKVVLSENLSENELQINGDAHLLKRLLRNVLENAFSFANTKVHIDIFASNEGVQISVRDNGTGFSTQALKQFGYRKVTRVLEELGANARLSVGLGSVIMRSIVDSHGGSLKASNVVLENGKVSGGQVEIYLPKYL